MNENELKKPLVLVADDDDDTVRLVKFYFEAEDFAVQTANNGAAAVEMFESSLNAGNKIVCCLLDYEMPMMKGDVAARAIQTLCAEKNWKTPEISMLTATVEGNFMSRMKATGIEVVFLKPQAWEDFEEYVKKLARRHKFMLAANA